MSLFRAVTDHYRKPRVLGLDLLRILASGTVIFYHGNMVGGFGRNPLSAVVASNGYLAVDIFFVLSGWLLTRQVLRMLHSFQSPFTFARTFWFRRWMRTLPPYWFVLLLVAVLTLPPTDRMSRSTVAGLLVIHAGFLQTIFVSPFQYLLGVAWSLVTEEWFYLLLPFAILLALRIRSHWMRAAIALIVLLIPSVVRAMLFSGPIEFWRVMTLPQARFDGLVIGALLAGASLNPQLWKPLVARRRLLCSLGMAMIAVTLLIGISPNRLYDVMGVLVFSLGVGLTMPQMSQLRWSLNTPAAAIMATAFLSELTYPLYLLHPLVDLHWTHQAGGARMIYALANAILLLAAATAVHLGIERPFLALRDRHETRRRWKEPAVFQEPSASPLAINPVGLSPRPAA